jgi:exoribonuclease R
VLHAFLTGHRDPEDFPSGEEMGALCAHINTAARTASQAENQMRKSLWLAELATADPATTYSARVTGVGPKGVFVTIDRSRVSGMVSTRELPGRGWAPTADGLALADAAGHRLGYGDVVTVRITSADWESGQLELALDGTTPEKAQRPRRPRKRTS